MQPALARAWPRAPDCAKARKPEVRARAAPMPTDGSRSDYATGIDRSIRRSSTSAPVISFRNFALRRGERLLLSNVDLTLHAGWRVGVIGRNGTGKSSLFAAIQGEVEADTRRHRRARRACASPASRRKRRRCDDPALDFVLSGDADGARRDRRRSATRWSARTGKPWPRRTTAWKNSTATTPPRAPASCCTAWASRPTRTSARSRSSPAAGACA